MAVDFRTIEDVIRFHLTFDVPASTGWNRLYCAVCGDGSRTKGPRGGWMFEDSACYYHCFNCGISGSFDPTREIPYSKEISKIFKSYGIPKDEYHTLIVQHKLNNKGQTTTPNKNISVAKGIEPPDHFYKLADADVDDVIARKAEEYLCKRHIDPKSYPFYLSTGISNSSDPKEISIAKTLRNRVIIPSLKNDQMVYWIARSLEQITKIPYINASFPKKNIIYGFNRLYRDEGCYLFVTEGFFDSHHLNGVAVLENHMTMEQIDILQKSPRRKVVVPDRKGDSRKLAEQAVKLGWGIGLPDIGSCKDTTEAIGKYGKLYVLHSIMTHIYERDAAKLALKLL